MFISSMAIIFIFGLVKKYLQEKNLGHFENSWTKKTRDRLFAEILFSSQNINKNSNFIFPNNYTDSAPASDPDSKVKIEIGAGIPIGILHSAHGRSRNRPIFEFVLLVWHCSQTKCFFITQTHRRIRFTISS